MKDKVFVFKNRNPLTIIKNGKIGFLINKKESCMDCAFIDRSCPCNDHCFYCYDPALSGRRISYFKEFEFDTSYFCRTFGRTLWLEERNI